METLNQPKVDTALALEVRKEAIRLITQLKDEGKPLVFIQKVIEDLNFLYQSPFDLT